MTYHPENAPHKPDLPFPRRHQTEIWDEIRKNRREAAKMSYNNGRSFLTCRGSRNHRKS
jgi:hypothetical protein